MPLGGESTVRTLTCSYDTWHGGRAWSGERAWPRQSEQLGGDDEAAIASYFEVHVLRDERWVHRLHRRSAEEARARPRHRPKAAVMADNV
jgi:hypothetical protein